jgi:hypothetical protein
MTHFEPDQDTCRALRDRFGNGKVDPLRDNVEVLEALGFPVLLSKRGPLWRHEPGARWSSKPSPLWTANDAFYVAKCMGMGLHSAERVPFRALGDPEPKHGYLVRVGYETNPHAGAAGGRGLTFAVAFTIAMLSMAGR